MAFRLFPPFMQFFDNSGNVLSNGSLTFTDTGTTTPKNTYSDKALAVLNTNPVLLLSSGRPATDIWGSGEYRVVLKNALGTVLGTFDNVEAPTEIPSQTGNSGEFLTTNGTTLSWTPISQVPSMVGQDGLYLTNDGTDASWAAVVPEEQTTVTAQTVAAATTLAIDVSLGPVVTLTQAVTISTLSFTNVPATGNAFALTIRRVKDATGTARAITWPASVEWASGAAPTLTQTTSARDDFTLLTVDGGVSWSGSYNLNLS